MNALFWTNAVALAAGTVAGAGFLGRYLAKVPEWWRDEHRVHVVSFSGIVFVFYLLYAVRYVTNPAAAPGTDPNGFNIVRAIAFVLLTVVVAWRWWIFERGMRRSRRIRPA